MPEFYTWAILLINQEDKIDEKQLSVFGSRGGQNSPLIHVPLSSWSFLSNEICLGKLRRQLTVYQSTDRAVHDLWWTIFYKYLVPEGMCGKQTGHGLQNREHSG